MSSCTCWKLCDIGFALQWLLELEVYTRCFLGDLWCLGQVFHPEVPAPACLARDRLVVKPIAHCLPALTLPCQEVGCPRCGFGGSLRLFPLHSCHHSDSVRHLSAPLCSRSSIKDSRCISNRLTPSAFLPLMGGPVVVRLY
jgi:hypothetical protein